MGWAASAGSGSGLTSPSRCSAVQNGTNGVKSATQRGAVGAAQRVAGSHRGIQDPELLRQRFFQFRAILVLGGRCQVLETPQIGFKDGPRGLVVTFQALETAINHLDAL